MNVPLDIRVWSEITTLQDASWSVTVLCPATLGIQPDQFADQRIYKYTCLILPGDVRK